MRRVVFDCNVLISALINSEGAPGQAFDHARKHDQLITSEACLAEIRSVCYREKFARYFSREEVDLFLEVFQASAQVVKPEEPIRVCRDPMDDIYLETAVAGDADFIVSGDPDLLALHPFRQIPILSPRDFLATIG